MLPTKLCFGMKLSVYPRTQAHTTQQELTEAAGCRQMLSLPTRSSCPKIQGIEMAAHISLADDANGRAYHAESKE